MFFPFQEVNLKTTPFSQTAVNGNCSLMHLHKFLYQRKPDARTSLIEKILIHQILEADKQRLLLVFRNTDSLVLYTDRNGILIFTNKNRNHLAVRRIFESIGKQVKHNLFQLIHIHPKKQMLFLRLKQEINPMFLGYGFEIIHDLTDKGHDIHTLHLHLHLLVLNLAEVQNLIDKTKHTVSIPLYHHQLFTDVLR